MKLEAVTAPKLSYAAVLRIVGDNYQRRAEHNRGVAARPRKANSLAEVASMERSHSEVVELAAKQELYSTALRALAAHLDRLTNYLPPLDGYAVTALGAREFIPPEVAVAVAALLAAGFDPQQVAETAEGR